MPERSPEEIRQSLVSTREELTSSLDGLQSKVTELTDWRRHLTDNREMVIIGAAVAGFVIGGGIAATCGLMRGRRRRRR